MAITSTHHLGLKAGGVMLSIASLVAFLALTIGRHQSDAAVVASFVAFFVGVVVFAFGSFMK